MLGLLISLFALPLTQEVDVPPVLSQVTVDASEAPFARITRLLAREFDVVYSHPGGGAYDLLCDVEDLERLSALGVPYHVVHDDLARFYEERLARGAPAAEPRLGAWLSPPFGQGSMGGYYTFAELESVLDQIAAAYPAIVTPKFTLSASHLGVGATHQGRELWAIKLSDHPSVDEDEPEVRLDALHHGREPQSMQCTLWTLLYLVENYGVDPRATTIVDQREIWFLPVVNPDGYVRNEETHPGGGGLWRKNLRANLNGTFGVDLNRNYPYKWGFDNVGSKGATGSEIYRGPGPASEPEVAAMVAFLSARDFRTALSTHTFSNVWVHPWGFRPAPPPNASDYAAISAHVTEVNRYPFGPASILLYLGNGVAADHDQGVHGTMSWTPEIGSLADGFWPARHRIVPLAEENLEAFLRTVLAAGSYPYLSDTAILDRGDGDGHAEPGEFVDLVVTLRNGGLDDTIGPVKLTMETKSPFARLGTSQVSLGPLSSFGEEDNQSLPFSLEIDAATPPGTRIDYTVRIEWDAGASQVVSQTLTVGRPVPFVVDDLESQVGWIAGLPGDTATTGRWEWGNPRATLLPPVLLASPEDDATPGAGVRCYITGNGIVVDADDVDDGFTTLISPRLDLSKVGIARLSYARWFGDRLVPDDVLEVSISADDGANWVLLEAVDRATYEWESKSFFVNDFVSPTDQVRLRFVLSDDPDNSVAEACVDELEVEIFEVEPTFNVYGRPNIAGKVAFHTASPGGGVYGVFESPGKGFFEFDAVNGPLLLDPDTMVMLVHGTVPSEGLARDVLVIPDEPSLIGQMRYYQAVISAPDGVWLTDRKALRFE